MATPGEFPSAFPSELATHAARARAKLPELMPVFWGFSRLPGFN